MKIQLDLFCSLLRETPEEKALDDSKVPPYLLEHLLNPFLEGQAIRLDSLDYGAFSLSDLDSLLHLVDNKSDICGKTFLKTDKLWKNVPSERTAGVFC